MKKILGAMLVSVFVLGMTPAFAADPVAEKKVDEKKVDEKTVAAEKTCKDKGLVAGNKQFEDCVKEETTKADTAKAATPPAKTETKAEAKATAN